MHAFVIGHTGVMRQGNATILTRIGVSPCRVTPFSSALAMSSLRKSAGILAEFSSMRSNASYSADDAIDSAGHNHDDHDAHMTDNGGSSPSPAPDDLHGNLDMPRPSASHSHADPSASATPPGPFACRSLASLHTDSYRLSQVPLPIALPAPSSHANPVLHSADLPTLNFVPTSASFAYLDSRLDQPRCPQLSP